MFGLGHFITILCKMKVSQLNCVGESEDEELFEDELEADEEVDED